MARRTARSSSSRSSSSRQAKATSKKSAASTEVEVIEEAEDGNIDSAVVMLTTVCLVAGILCMDKILGMYDAGFFL